MKVIAKMDAGVLNYRTEKLVKPLADKKDKSVYPDYENGGFVIVKGKEYELSDSYKAEPDQGLWKLFEPAKSKVK